MSHGAIQKIKVASLFWNTVYYICMTFYTRHDQTCSDVFRGIQTSTNQTCSYVFVLQTSPCRRQFLRPCRTSPVAPFTPSVSLPHQSDLFKHVQTCLDVFRRVQTCLHNSDHENSMVIEDNSSHTVLTVNRRDREPVCWRPVTSY